MKDKIYKGYRIHVDYFNKFKVMKLGKIELDKIKEFKTETEALEYINNQTEKN